jgi:hypothetical protein
MDINCIVTQIHIPDFDPQGSLSAEDKKEILDTNIKNLRANNPAAYIILAGHGHEPLTSTKQICDDIIWEDLHPIDGGGTVVGMPAQYKSVFLGIQRAQEEGFDYCVKTRGDSVLARGEIATYCDDILEEEGKKLLLTQQTGKMFYKFGDCFMYGEIDLLMSIWNKNNPPFHADGLIHTGASFVKHFTGAYPPQQYTNAPLHNGKNWNELLRHNCSFRDIGEIGFCDLRWNYNRLKNDWANTKNKIINLQYDYPEIYWGRANGWHIFDSDGRVTSHGPMCDWSYTKEEFYKK